MHLGQQRHHTAHRLWFLVDASAPFLGAFRGIWLGLSLNG
jgi:hypothetical protein